MFANREKALAWLETPNPSLQGKTPIEAANTEEGFEQADEILTRLGPRYRRVYLSDASEAAPIR